MLKEWVDEKLQVLSLKLKYFKPNSDDFFFEPTEKIYEKLESGDEYDLRYVAREIARHIGIISIPTITYDWGLKMEPEVAGQIKGLSQMHHIQIPFFYVGKKYEVGGILAHEMTHALLYSKGISLEDQNENEVFTDLAAIFIGLGKLLLNGYVCEGYVLGYLSPELIAYCHEKVSASRSIGREVAMKNLTPEARNRCQ